MNTRSLALVPLCFVLGAVVLLTPVSFNQVWGVNRWSAQVAHAILRRDAGNQAAFPPGPVNHPRYALWKGSLALRRGDLKEAVAVLSERSVAHPNDLGARILLGEALERKGQLKLASAEWLQVRNSSWMLRAAWDAYVAGQLDDALVAFQAAYEVAPLRATLGLSHTLWQKKEFGSTEALLRRSLDVAPDYEESRLWRTTLAEVLMADGRWADAVVTYRAALTVEPRNASFYYGLGKALYHVQGLAVAIAEVDRGIALAPGEVGGYVTMADLLSTDKRYAEADAWYLKAIAHSPDNYLPWFRRGGNALAAGDTLAGIAHYEEVIAKFSDKTPPNEMAGVYRALAHAYWSLGDGSQTMAAIEKAFLLKATDPLTWTTAGAIYEWNKEPDKASRAYRQALALDPTNENALQGIQRLAR